MSDNTLKQIEKKEKRELKRRRRLEKNTPPKRSLLEEIFNSISHGLGAGLAVAGFILLLTASDTAMEYLGAFFYGICLIILFLNSCLYHAWKSGSKVKRLWRRFDYLSIYLLIGGTFSPMYLVYWGGVKGLVFFCIMWGIIATGITLIAVYGPGGASKVHFILYLILGWSGIMFMPGFYKNDRELLYFILGGGIVYTLGVIPFKIKKPWSHLLWHFFVIGGAVLHWFGIYLYIY